MVITQQNIQCIDLKCGMVVAEMHPPKYILISKRCVKVLFKIMILLFVFSFVFLFTKCVMNLYMVHTSTSETFTQRAKIR